MGSPRRAGRTPLLQRYEDEWRDLFGETGRAAAGALHGSELERFDQIIKSSWIAYETTMPNLSRMLGTQTHRWSNLQADHFLPSQDVHSTASRKDAASITGSMRRCATMVKLLESMIPVPSPKALVETCLPRAKEPRGSHQQRLQPGWVPAVGTVSAGHKSRQRKDPLFLSVHAGFIDEKDATGLKQAEVADWSMSSATTRRCANLPRPLASRGSRRV
jgi:hypothetical protein